MLYNTKLTKEDKVFSRQMVRDFKDAGGVVVHAGPVTVAVIKTGHNMAAVSIAIASENERKIRKSVGADFAVDRNLMGLTVPARVDGQTLENVAYAFAYAAVEI